MAILKAVQPGDVLLDRRIYGEARFGLGGRLIAFVNYPKILNINSGERLLERHQLDRHHYIQYLFLETRRGRKNGTLVTEEVAELLRPLGIKLIRICSENYNHYRERTVTSHFFTLKDLSVKSYVYNRHRSYQPVNIYYNVNPEDIIRNNPFYYDTAAYPGDLFIAVGVGVETRRLGHVERRYIPGYVKAHMPSMTNAAQKSLITGLDTLTPEIMHI